MNKRKFLNQIDEKINKNHLLNHSFYKAWNAGELDITTIQEYAAQYYKHVSAFPRYLSAIHSNCDNISIRQVLLENLMDEELGNENHPELWIRFAEGMGNTRDQLANTIPITETRDLVDTFNKLSQSDQYHVGLAALYCYESMQPEISETKKRGLQKHYGIVDENALKFFTVHMHADKWHREVIRKLLVELSNTKQKQQEILNAVSSALMALNNFLTGIEKNHC